MLPKFPFTTDIKSFTAGLVGIVILIIILIVCRAFFKKLLERSRIMRSVFYFEEMIVPKIITFVYWLALLFAVVSGLGTMFGGYEGVSFGKFLSGLGIMVGIALVARIWCELTIVLFKIHENIHKIANKE